ncbi:hypothetical protein [Thalassospira alkalitolerans]|uniref:hypothetical protein n=1 Tax=Thalassospira alkalitolerans TaxID=1293890 RepID=UPI0030EF8CE2
MTTFARCMRGAGFSNICFLLHSQIFNRLASDLAAGGFEAVQMQMAAGTVMDIAETHDVLLPRPHAETGIFVCDARTIGTDYLSQIPPDFLSVIIDDFEEVWPLADIFVNPNPWGGVVINGKKVNNNSNLIDPKYFSLTVEEGKQKSEFQILLTMGGEDPLNHTLWILQHAQKQLAECKLRVVIGPSYTSPEHLKNFLEKEYPLAEVLVSPEGLFEAMRNVDAAVSAGGITCYELLAAEIPTIAISVEEHQDQLVRYLTSEKAALGVEFAFNRREHFFVKMFEDFLEGRELRASLAKRGRELFSPDGTAQIVKLILSVLSDRRK